MVVDGNYSQVPCLIEKNRRSNVMRKEIFLELNSKDCLQYDGTKYMQ